MDPGLRTISGPFVYPDEEGYRIGLDRKSADGNRDFAKKNYDYFDPSYYSLR